MSFELTPEQLSQAKAILTVFQERFPKTFFNDTTEIRPLKIDIHRDLYAVFAEQYPKKAINRALKIYTKCPDYFNALTLGAQRVDLEGNLSGEVTQEHLEIAENAKAKQQRRWAKQEEAQKQLELEQEEKRRKQQEEEAKSLLQEKVKSAGRLKLGLKKKETASKLNPMLKIRVERTVQEEPVTTAEQSTRKRVPAPLSRIAKKQLEQRRKEKELSQLPFGKMEVRLKIEALPNDVKAVKHGWQRFTVRDDKCFACVTVRPRTWKKLQEAPTRYSYWVANITGKMGQRLKGQGEGFELLDPVTQIFERIPTSEELENAPVKPEADNNHSEEE
ncbi:MAG: hypothetical protein BWK79_18510 [Beggiatoa sp. IS2]|nr:MAG: hypothetical protein BWK79_18510 [Beggiatoa sp. IS2]